LRPDQRALENGDMKLAASEKFRLEEAQRARKKKIDKEKRYHDPSYFSLNENNEWVSNGTYWNGRAPRENILDIFA
jgi:hypothetical protein